MRKKSRSGLYRIGNWGKLVPLDPIAQTTTATIKTRHGILRDAEDLFDLVEHVDSHQNDPDDLFRMYRMALLHRGRYRRAHGASWTTTNRARLVMLPEAVAIQTHEDTGMNQYGVYRVGGDALIFLTIGSNGSLVASIGFYEDADLAAALAFLRATWPMLSDDDERQRVNITFWTQTAQGPLSTQRAIGAPTWDNIAGNYTLDTRRSIDVLLANVPPKSGQLILWSGIPGTGKSFALRALAQEWRGWARLHYITDPETFFGEASYLMHLTLQAASEDDGDEKDWRIFVLEDAGELLAADAKERVGQALSRLLNLVDGFIGQGLRILVLVTTNERVEKLHPAVSRPGRCLHRHEFQPLTVEEANAWLVAKGSRETVSEPTSIAKLYGLLAGNPVTGDAPDRKMGF